MRKQGRAVVVLLTLSSLMVIAPVSSSFAGTPPPAKDAKEEAKPKPQPAHPAPVTTDKTKVNAARKAAEARMARCRLHPEICVQ
jgi:hypothetical protein